ncbi:MAG: hypothetical protein F4W90_03020 [Gammaproteobacteria bacterium]|nr:hypothetical protein [Gammaproteobacteria bacterium]
MKRLSMLAGFVVLGVAAQSAYADESKRVATHNLTVSEKLELLETIEITSEKELKPVPEQDRDPEVDALLEEIGQFESDASSSDSNASSSSE